LSHDLSDISGYGEEYKYRDNKISEIFLFSIVMDECFSLIQNETNGKNDKPPVAEGWWLFVKEL
jgi:hypothetical protein